MNDLAGLIKYEIQTQGPITFARFMEMALYHPELGYYSSPAADIGRSGDYYTAPSVSPLFGTMLARQFAEMWRKQGCPSPWALVEYGPGTGALARDVLNASRQRYPDFYEALTYYLVEISPGLRERQRRELCSQLQDATKFRWVDGAAKAVDSGAIAGCIFANELVDALPVHLVQRSASGLMELYVNYNSREFCLVEGPPSTAELENYFVMQHVELAVGQKAEVNLLAGKWLSEIADSLGKGYVMIIDYGATAAELYASHRFKGTLRCFHKHRLIENPFVNIGQQDITAHVNFTALAMWGARLGLQELGLVSQPQFLLNLGILDELQGHDNFTHDATWHKKTAAFKQLVLPGGMGDIFKVLLMYKGFPVPPELTGLKYKAGLAAPQIIALRGGEEK
mgnify:CR=1 FL=1